MYSNFLTVPVVQKTVGKYATENLVYYSETVDPSVPTEDIGVPNTERGRISRNLAGLLRICANYRRSSSPSHSIYPYRLLAVAHSSN